MLRYVVGALVCAGLWGCNGSKPTYTRSSGSVALSNDGSTVYAVDTDNNALILANAADGTAMQTVAVGKTPLRVTVGLDDRIYVSNSGERTVSVLARDSGGQIKETTRIPVDVEPVGLSLTPDGTQLLVVSATSLNDPTQGTLTAINTKTLATSWKVNVGEEPRGVAVVGQTAYVTNLKQGSVTKVDLLKQATAGTISLNNDPGADPVANPDVHSAGAATEIVPSADGSRLYIAHAFQKVGAITATDNGAEDEVGGGGGSYGGGGTVGTNNAGGIVTAGLGTIDTGSGTSLSDSFQANVTKEVAPNFPRSSLSLLNSGLASQGPSAVIVDPTGQWIFVANKLSNNVLVLPASRTATDPDPASITVGAGPDGMALSNDGKTLYVYSQFDHTLTLVTSNGSNQSGTTTTNGNGDIPTTSFSTDTFGLQVSGQHALANDTLTPAQVAGRKMFFSAVDPRMTSVTTALSCGSCHIDGREDGHVWQFPDGKRQTPSLAARSIEKTAPYHWASIFPTLNDFFTETIVGRMGGQQLNSSDSTNLQAYIESIPKPENPLQNRTDMASNIAAGRAAFEKATCNSCHAGDVLTDNLIHNVGTLHSDDLLEVIGSNGVGGDPATFPPLQFVNTPSLLGLGRTGPYLHDGSIPTVSARIAQAETASPLGINYERHGDTSQLSAQELADLQTYLLAL